MSSMTQKNEGPSFMATAGKAAMVGAVGGIAGSYLFGSEGTLPLMGMDVSIPVALGTAIGSASFIGEYAAGYVLPMLPQSAGAAKMEGMVLKPALTAAAAYGTVTMLLGTVEQPVQLLMLGAGSEVAGSYGWGTVSPLLGWGKGSAAAEAATTF